MRERTAKIKTKTKINMKPMQQPPRLGETQTALTKLKTRKSHEPDGITNDMFIHLGFATL